MSVSLGIVGLPNVGKSTLFNTLSRARAEASNYPFCTIDPNVGVVEVPDERLAFYAKTFLAAKSVPTTLEFYDIAGLVKGASKGEGLGNQFLAHIRQVDAIAHVVRCFPDPNIVHVSGSVDPKRDVEIINLELILADLQSVEKRLSGKESSAKSGDKKTLEEMAFWKEVRSILEKGRPARELKVEENQEHFVKELPLLTLKPVIYVANVDESGNPDQVEKLKEAVKDEKARVVVISAQIESEIKELSDEEAKAYMQEIGLKRAGLDRLIMGGYELLDLITYFTAGPKEARAWTITRGTKAPQAAGKIHSDFERGFIAADVIHYKDILETRSFNLAKERGLVRTEGKSYIVVDGDWMLFKFNV